MQSCSSTMIICERGEVVDSQAWGQVKSLSTLLSPDLVWSK